MSTVELLLLFFGQAVLEKEKGRTTLYSPRTIYSNTNTRVLRKVELDCDGGEGTGVLVNAVLRVKLLERAAKRLHNDRDEFKPKYDNKLRPH